MLALAQVLSARGGDVVAGTQLKPEYFPELMVSRVRKVGGAELRTEILRGLGGEANGVRFWTFKPGTAQTHFERSKDCFLLGELRIERAVKGLPVSVYFVANGMHVAPKQGDVQMGSPLFEVIYKGEIQDSQTVSIYNDIAYDDVAEAQVTDLRFAKVAKLRYSITKGDELPFLSDNPNISNIATKAYAAQIAKLSQKQTRRGVIMGAFAFLTLAIAGFFFLRAASGRKNKNIAALAQT